MHGSRSHLLDSPSKADLNRDISPADIGKMRMDKQISLK